MQTYAELIHASLRPVAGQYTAGPPRTGLMPRRVAARAA
jgi:hypothetical protein